MKKQILSSLLLVLILATSALAQRKVKDGTVTGSSDLPVSTALMELESNNKGLLLPRMSTAQRNAIASPASGLMVYNTDLQCTEFYNGSTWISKCAPATMTASDCNFASIGNLATAQLTDGTQVQIIRVNVTQPGAYSLRASTNGVTFAASGTFTTTGPQMIVMPASGTPQSFGTFTYTISGGPSCAFSRYVFAFQN